MNVFISGGCKNGKSYYAQRRARALAGGEGETGPLTKKLYYIATMIPHDDEDRARIRRHLSEREGWGFETVEQGKNLTEILNKNVDPGGVFLLDSVTAVMENEMYPVALKERGDEKVIVFLGEDADASERVKRDMVRFAEEIKRNGGSVVFVSDGIYGDMNGYSESTEKYRQALAETDRALAEVCDEVIEIAYGAEEIWKR